LRETLFKGLFRARFRYDVFISYSHRDAKGYAANLKKQLSSLDFACFIDEEESPPGLSLGPTLEKALRKSAVLVLLATERALTRPYIALEFERFVGTNRTIIPINILGALTNNNEEALSRTPWNLISERKLIWIDESDEAFAKQNPSPPIADGIDRLFKYTRRNVRVRTEIIGTAALVLLAAFGAGFVIKGQAAEVSKQAGLAEVARQETKKQQELATDASREAKRQLDLAADATREAERQGKVAADAKKEAEQQGKAAAEAKKEAEHQQQLAGVATAEAKKQQAAANAAKLEADRQQAIAKQELERVEHLRYVSDINVAQRAYETDDMPRANEFLTAQLPEIAEPKPTDLRGFEWYYLWRLQHNQLGTLNEQSGHVKDMVFSPDGQTVVTVNDGSGNVLQVRNANSWQEIGELEGSAGVKSAVFSPDSQKLAAETDKQGLRLWDMSSRQPLWTLDGPAWPVAFSPDGKRLATTTLDTVTLWDTSTHEKMKEIKVALPKPVAEKVTSRRRPKSSPSVTAIKFSPDGKLLITVVNDIQVAQLWETATGKELMSLKDDKSGESFFMEFSPDGKVLATGGRSTPVTLWDTTTLKELWKLADGAYSVKFSPDGKTLFTHHYDLKLWDTKAQKELGTLKQNSDDIDVEAFSPDGTMLATGERGSTVTLWDMTGQELARFKLGKYATEFVAFSPDGKTLVAKSNDGAMKLWDVSSREQLGKPKGYAALVSSLTFSPQRNTLVAVDDGTVKWWDTNIQQELATLTDHSPYLSSLEFLNAGRILGTHGRDNSVKVWDTVTRTELGQGMHGQHSFTGNAIAFSKDGQTVAVADFDSDNTVKLVETRTLRERGRLTGLTSRVKSVEFAPDGKILATGSEDKVVTLTDTSSLKEVQRLNAQVFGLGSRLFSPNGKMLVAGGDENTLKLWDTSSWKELGTLKGHAEYIRFVVFSADSSTLAAVASNGVELWDLTTQKALTMVKGFFDERSPVALSPDGKILAIRSGGESGAYFKLMSNDGSELALLRGQPGALSVTFSPDGKSLATGGEDGRVKLWETITGQELVTFKAHSNAVVSVAFSADSKILATGSRDTTVKLWYAASENEVIAQRKKPAQQ
jgi:WD40 repeat protein